jgi:hypothetical protein
MVEININLRRQAKIYSACPQATTTPIFAASRATPYHR